MSLPSRGCTSSRPSRRWCPMGVWMTKEVAWSQLEVGSLQAGIDLENRTQIMSTFTRDHHEQVTAFLEKRPPHYTNE